jgi:probable HAF family extracellular repeat protein
VIAPPKGNYAIPFTINNGGVVVGSFNYGQFGAFTGFEMLGSRWAIISPPQGSLAAVFGVTAKGTLFGSATGANSVFYFSYSQGNYSKFTIPNAPGYFISGVNPEGTALVGFYNPSSGVTASFIYQNQTITTLQFPGSSFTQASGISKTGEVVGFFEDAEGNGHGFTWTPPADAAKK